jgi:hypothetical protein
MEDFKAGSVTYSINITGGKPPYTVTWTSDHGTLATGKGKETVTLPVNQLRWNGAGYYVWVSVMDSAGEGAAWVDSVGNAHEDFAYGVTASGPDTEPKFPYKAFGVK